MPIIWPRTRCERDALIGPTDGSSVNVSALMVPVPARAASLVWVVEQPAAKAGMKTSGAGGL